MRQVSHTSVMKSLCGRKGPQEINPGNADPTAVIRMPTEVCTLVL